MSKDLFRKTFQEFSQWPFEKYDREYLKKLPYKLLEPAVRINPQLRNCKGFEELFVHLRNADEGCAGNPELYPFLNALNVQGNEDLDKCVNLLRVHVGLSRPDPAEHAHAPFLRLRQPNVGVFKVSNNEILEVDKACTPGAKGLPSPMIYPPLPRLFEDIEPRLYRGDSSSDIEKLRQLYTDAILILDRYCPSLSASFRTRIATIAFMPRQTGEAKSFSKRNFYIGGIFVSISEPLTLAEQFIHEYYHQQIWPWWMVEKPADLPGEELSIVSPVTGRVRSVFVMIQAFLIYCSLIDFYRFTTTTMEKDLHSGSTISDALERLKKIECGYCPLLNELRSALIDRPLCRALVESIAGFVKI